MAHPQAPGLPIRQPVHEGGDGVLVAGEHHRLRAVHGGHRHPLGQEWEHLGLGGPHGHHRPAGRQRPHQPATCRHQGARVGEGQHTGHVGGGQFADGVAEDEVRSEPPRLEQPEQRDLDGEQPGLRVLGPVHRLRVGEHDLRDRAVEVPVQFGADRVESLGEHRVRLVQRASHADPLGTLPGEQVPGRPGGDDVPHQVR